MQKKQKKKKKKEKRKVIYYTVWLHINTVDLLGVRSVIIIRAAKYHYLTTQFIGYTILLRKPNSKTKLSIFVLLPALLLSEIQVDTQAVVQPVQS